MKITFKSTNTIVLFMCAVFLINCNSCSTSHKAESRYLQVSPEQSNSGEIIYLYDSTRSIKPDSNTIIKFGESTGIIMKTDTSGQIAVLVPNLKHTTKPGRNFLWRSWQAFHNNWKTCLFAGTLL